ncbi:hypothetical protein B0H17DRAFT_1206713 [Mycena rosella]|uniref:Uncharacterized protein n=1 Tax=Mycena rosella TaxID=1033263 RepID=A0AAD7G8R3_MYCRO|nr:hypothetical protein B0H17DRAFT_1206713 [Mycena rosella]
MSARQPFVPGNGFASSSRPESRAAASTPLHFVADASNPLHGGRTTNQTNGETAPLNIASFTKSTRIQNPPSRRQSIQTPRPATADPRSSSSNNHTHNLRPGTSDPHSKPNFVPNHRLQAHSLAKNIVAPTPLQARATPSLFSNAPPSFKTPVLSDAHGFRTPKNDAMQTNEIQPPSPEQDVPENNAPFRLKTLPSQPGPHRRAFGARAIADLTAEDEIFDVPEANTPTPADGTSARAPRLTTTRATTRGGRAETRRYQPLKLRSVAVPPHHPTPRERLIGPMALGPITTASFGLRIATIFALRLPRSAITCPRHLTI